MSALYKNLRIHQVFGANTDVGKTIITSALVRASAARQQIVHYLKPVSTGPMRDADDEHVLRFGGPLKAFIRPQCLFRYQDPVSPHLAAVRETDSATDDIPSDRTLVNAIANHIRMCAGKPVGPACMYVETAGGVHSPTLSGTTQVDAYRPLFLPTILVGDSRLGGISSTISSYESLLLRGYIVDAILLFKEEYYRNWEYLTSYFAERGVHVAAFAGPPPRLEDDEANFGETDSYYDALSSGDSLQGVVRHLDERHASRLDELESMPRRTLDTVWWPFVQHGLVGSEKDVKVIDSASSDFFSVYTSKSQEALSAADPSLLHPQFDGSASWWTQAVGHAHPRLTLAAARAAGRYGHVMFPQASHLPALKFSERLVRDGPGQGWASRAFISDNGSTGMEVALKMALRTFVKRQDSDMSAPRKRQLGVLGLKGSYHGDTIGAMDACESSDGVYTCEWHDAKGFWFDPPSISMRDGQFAITLPPALASETFREDLSGHSLHVLYDVERRLSTPLANHYRTYIEQTLTTLRTEDTPLAALVLEPLVLGAGGMVFVDPLFQRILVDVARSSLALPVVFDEVFTGLYRAGFPHATAALGVSPDISVHAKILTGGTVPLAVTLATDAVFQAFLGDNKSDALLHGHSYSAYAVGCEVANETLEIIDGLCRSEEWSAAQQRWSPAQAGESALPARAWSFWDPDFVRVLSEQPSVQEVMTLGTVLAFKTTSTGGYRSSSAQTLLRDLERSALSGEGLSPAPGGAAYGIHFRTLGDVAYFMLSLNTPSETIRSVEDRIWEVVSGSK